MHGSGCLSSKITILQFDMTQINSEQPNIPCLSSNFTQAQRLLNEIFPDYTKPVQALLKSEIAEKEGCSTFAQVLDEMMQKFGKAILKELHMPNGASLVTPKSDELDQPVVRVILENFALTTRLDKENPHEFINGEILETYGYCLETKDKGKSIECTFEGATKNLPLIRIGTFLDAAKKALNKLRLAHKNPTYTKDRVNPHMREIGYYTSAVENSERFLRNHGYTGY